MNANQVQFACSRLSVTGTILIDSCPRNRTMDRYFRDHLHSRVELVGQCRLRMRFRKFCHTNVEGSSGMYVFT